MDANVYQLHAARTLINDDAVPDFAAGDLALIWDLLTVAENAGVAAECGKKGILHQHGLESGSALYDALLDGLDRAAEQSIHTATYLQDQDRPWAIGLAPRQVRILWNLTGLAGELGEVIGTCKHALANDQEPDRDGLIKELGDVAWYLAALCTVLDIPLSTVLETNLTKLQARYPAGWDQQRSKHGGQS